MKKDEKALVTYVLASMFDVRVIKNVFLHDAHTGLNLIKNKKHQNGKVIKRRNKTHETIYKQQTRCVTFWNEVLQYKRQFDLLEVEEVTEEMVAVALNFAKEIVSFRVKIYKGKGKKYFAKRNDFRMTADTFIRKEIERMTKLKLEKKRLHLSCSQPKTEEK